MNAAMIDLDEVATRHRIAANLGTVLGYRCTDLDVLAVKIGLSRPDLDDRLAGRCDFYVSEMFRLSSILGFRWSVLFTHGDVLAELRAADER